MGNESNQKLSANLASHGAAQTPLSFKDNLSSWWRKNGADIKRLIGGSKDAERLFSSAMLVINKNPTLMECDPMTFFQCLMQSAALRLYPGPLNECAYVPFRNSKRNGIREATFMPMYPGVVKLAFNGGFVKRIAAQVVYEADEFEYMDGLDPVLNFKPFLGDEKDRGNRLLTYAFVVTRYNEIQIAVLSPWMVEQHRKRSKAADSSDSPWNSKYSEDVDWMWKKTALVQALKLVPKSPELAQAIDMEVQDQRPKEIITTGDVLSALKNNTSEGTIGQQPQATVALPEGPTGIQMDMSQKANSQGEKIEVPR